MNTECLLTVSLPCLASDQFVPFLPTQLQPSDDCRAVSAAEIESGGLLRIENLGESQRCRHNPRRPATTPASSLAGGSDGERPDNRQPWMESPAPLSFPPGHGLGSFSLPDRTRRKS